MPNETPALTREQLVNLALKLQQQVARLQQDVQTNQLLAQDADLKIADLKQQLANATSLINAQLDTQRTILESISTMDSVSGQYIPRINANMDKAEFEADFTQAVQQVRAKTYPTHGTLTLVNKMSSDQIVSINGTQHTVMEGARLPISVPLKTITARFSGRAPTYWNLEPPSYSLTLEIVPDRYSSSTSFSTSTYPTY